MRRVAALVLAAGGSRRMGFPKQLLALEGRSLVQRAATAASEAGCARVFVVVGAQRAAVEAVLDRRIAEPVFNPAWQSGLASSLRAGMAEVRREERSCDGVLVVLADQPRVHAGLLLRLLRAFESPGVERVACAYRGMRGAPALFGRSWFPAMEALQGDCGARVLLRHAGPDLVALDAEAFADDVDTPEDWSAVVGKRGPDPP